MQGKETTSIHLDLPQVGLTSFLWLVERAFWASKRPSVRQSREKSLQVGFFGKSAIRRVHVQFLETVYRLTS